MKHKLLEKIRKYPTLISFIQYGTVGIVGTIIHTVILSICVELFHITPVISTIVGFLFSLIVSYILNSVWTFKQSNKGKNSFIKYLITCSLGLAINVFIMFIVVDVLQYMYLLGQLVSIIIVPIFNFSVTKKWVFSKRKPHSSC